MGWNVVSLSNVLYPLRKCTST